MKRDAKVNQATPIDLKESECKNADAFRFCRYQSAGGEEVEYVWNSRDGEAPAEIVNVARTGKLLRSRDSLAEAFEPANVPKPGERIFIDLTPEMAATLAREIAESRPEAIAGFLSRGGSRMAAIEHLTRIILGDGKRPAIITVTRSAGTVVMMPAGIRSGMKAIEAKGGGDGKPN